ncbi:MAG: septum formation protein Maf, partial [Candidatus Izimaplasma sp.]|nr:septum formation protein Maf [Candidatus Izimaplasma bacterium]
MNNVNKRFILASKSPRRIELLKVLDIDYIVIPSDIDEIINDKLTNEEVVMDLALKKAEDISSKNQDYYVLGFDTLVILDGIPLGKPLDEDDAFRMLKLLSGRTHVVLTGCAIVNNIYRDSFYSSAEVTFYDMTDEEIREYVATKEPLDKAGAYGI